MSRRILVVDDNPEEAALIAQMVSSLLDSEVEIAGSRHEARLKLQQRRADVVVVDLDLNGLSEGRLLLESIQTYFRPPPGVVIVSTFGNEPESRELKARFSFVTEVIAKRDITQLTGTLRRALAEASSGRLGEIVDEAKPPEDETAKRSRRIIVIAAIITAVATIIAALIRVLGQS